MNELIDLDRGPGALPARRADEAALLPPQGSGG